MKAAADPSSVLRTMWYLQEEAALGHFNGHTSAYLVLTYLVLNMWTKSPNGDDACPGDVMRGRAAIETIAGGTTLSRRSVQYALTWLQEAGWIDTARVHMPSGRETTRDITVLLDGRAQRDRERKRDLDRELEVIMGSVQ